MLTAAALTAALLAAPESGAAQSDSGTAGMAGVTGKARTVTLVTGDRVTLDATGQVTGVRPGKGREGTAFRIARDADRTYVVPRDAERLLANGTADRRLFDVTQLVKWGYDDAARPDLPLIVTYAKGRALAPSALSAAGPRVSRDLPSVNGDALKARKSEGAELWETLTGSGGTARARSAAADRVEKIWLDGEVEAALDRSEDVPQDASLCPAGEIPEYRAPRNAEVGGQRPPLRPVVGDVADGVEHPAAGPLLRSPALWGLAGRNGQEPFKESPFQVAGVRRVAVAGQRHDGVPGRDLKGSQRWGGRGPSPFQEFTPGWRGGAGWTRSRPSAP